MLKNKAIDVLAKAIRIVNGVDDLEEFTSTAMLDISMNTKDEEDQFALAVISGMLQFDESDEELRK